MNGTKLIGMLVAVVMVGSLALAQKVETNAVTTDDIRQAYSEIKGDMAKAEQCLAMCEALDDDVIGRIYTGHCLRTLKRYEEAIVAYQRAVELSGNDSAVLDRMTCITATYYAMNQYQTGIDVLRAAIVANSGASDRVRASALTYLAKGFTQLGDHKASNTALIEAITLRIQAVKVVDAQIWRNLEALRPGDMTAEEYTAVLADIIKITPATEENAGFLGRVKSELEKMK